MRKLIMMLTAVVSVSLGAWAEPMVTDITAKQRYPWNGLVDIDCTVSGIEGAANGYKFVVVAVDKDSGKEYAATHFTAKHYGGANVPEEGVTENGDYALLWNAREDMGQVVIERMAMRVTLEAAGVSVSSGKVQLWEGGPYWADRNIGASAPEDYGLYFWWGDTTGHRPSSDGTFNFNFAGDNPDISTYGKYQRSILAPANDAAHIHWGGAWRMPTEAEFSALINNCDWTWMTLNGVNGYLVRGRGTYAHNRIFLPATGYGAWTSLRNAGSHGHYWSSVPNADFLTFDVFAWALDFNSDDRRTGNGSGSGRASGQPVRPVQGFTE